MSVEPRSVRWLARVGLLSRGAVYILVGVLALLVALHGPGGKATDVLGAMRELVRKPLGTLLLITIASGLLCYAVWRLLDGIFDYDEYGRRWDGIVVRVGQIVGGVVHIAFGAYGLNLIFLFKRTTLRPSEQRLARWLFAWPYGDYLVGLVGFAVLVFGVAQFVISWREAFRHYMEIPMARERILVPLCKWGLMARGIVFSLIGTFFFNAALTHSSHEAGGFKKAWAALREQPFGELWMAFVALGLIAYGLFSAAEARYRKISGSRERASKSAIAR